MLSSFKGSLNNSAKKVGKEGLGHEEQTPLHIGVARTTQHMVHPGCCARSRAGCTGPNKDLDLTLGMEFPKDLV